MNQKDGSKPPKNPHDRYVKASFDEPRVVLDLFESWLSPEVKKLCRYTEFERIKESFVDHELQECFTDVLFRVPMVEDPDGSAWFYFLIEHLRTNDRMVAFRDWGYKHRIAEFHIQQTQRNEIPFIQTFVIYNGETSFTAPVNPVGLVNAPEPLARSMFEGFRLIDVSNISDAILKEQIWAGVFLMMLKHINDPDIVAILVNLAYHLREIGANGTGLEFLSVVLTWLARAGKSEQPELIAQVIREHVSAEAEVFYMSIADVLEKRGLEKGIEKGIEQERKEFTLRLIRQGVDRQTIQAVSLLSFDQIDALFRRERGE